MEHREEGKNSGKEPRREAKQRPGAKIKSADAKERLLAYK